jgi:hypothetical protein
LSRLGLYVDWMELTWNEWVINYDFAHQVQMAQVMQRNTRNWTEAARRWFTKKETSGKRWMDRRGGFTLVLPVAIALLLVLLRYDVLRFAIQKLRFYLQLRAPEMTRANPQLASRLYAELLGVLQRRGLVRRDSETPLEFAMAVNEPSLSSVVREFTLLYAQARFGGAPCDTLRLRGLLERARAARP